MRVKHAQGTIISIEQTQASVFTSLITVEVDPGYPSIVTLNIDSVLIGIVYDDVGQMNPNTSGTLKKLEKPSPPLLMCLTEDCADIYVPPYVGTSIVNGSIQYTFDVSLLQNVYEGQRLAVRQPAPATAAVAC